MSLSTISILKSTPIFGETYSEQIGEAISLLRYQNSVQQDLLYYSNSNSIVVLLLLFLGFLARNNYIKMKTPYKNIYNILKLNRFIVLAVVIAATITCIVSVVLVVKLHKETVNNAFLRGFYLCLRLFKGVSILFKAFLRDSCPFC